MMTAGQVAEELRQAFRDGSLARRASVLIREQGIEREEAEREIIGEILQKLFDDPEPETKP
jgi:hypothetical protein